MSKRIQRILYTYNRVKLTLSKENKDITLDNIATITKQACKEMSKIDKVSAHVVMNSMICGLEVNSLSFYKMIRDHLLSENKQCSELVNSLCHHSCDGDSNANIISKLCT